MNKFFLIFQYFRYLLKARDEHSLHSPFAYNFYTEIIKDRFPHEDFNEIELLRKRLKRNFKTIKVTDLGAGSGVDNSKSKSISAICINSEKKPAIAQLIYRIIKSRQSKTIIDLGTSLGITTLYEAKANPLANVYTFEGCINTAIIAKENFESLSVRNIEIVVGNIDNSLSGVIEKLPLIDFAFFDANHRYEPTMNYFLKCLEKANEDSVFIFDDIYWSKEMKQAWEKIKRHPSVGMSMDLFFVGIIFFRKKQPVQHFTLK